MKVRCQFYDPQNIVQEDYTIEWSNIQAKRMFASDADGWLRLGPGYRVETEAV